MNAFSGVRTLPRNRVGPPATLVFEVSARSSVMCRTRRGRRARSFNGRAMRASRADPTADVVALGCDDVDDIMARGGRTWLDDHAHRTRLHLLLVSKPMPLPRALCALAAMSGLVLACAPAEQPAATQSPVAPPSWPRLPCRLPGEAPGAARSRCARMRRWAGAAGGHVDPRQAGAAADGRGDRRRRRASRGRRPSRRRHLHRQLDRPVDAVRRVAPRYRGVRAARCRWRSASTRRAAGFSGWPR